MRIDCTVVPTGDRFSYWAEAMKSSLYHAEALRNGNQAEPFEGVAEAWHIADAVFGRQVSSSYRAVRSERLIGEYEAGMLVVGAPQTVSIVTDFPRYSRLIGHPGDLLIFDSDIEWSAETSAAAEYHALLIPRARLRPFIGDSTKVRPRLLQHGQHLQGMLSAMMREFIGLRGRTDNVAEGATDVLVHLLAVACGLHPGDDRLVRQSLSDVRLLQAAQFILANVHDPALGAPLVARHLGISVRRLHALYEPTGGSVSQQILRARIAKAQQMLALSPRTTVLEVALSCGFYSQSTFYRSFTSSLGMTPGEFRQRTGDGDLSAPAASLSDDPRRRVHGAVLDTSGTK